MRRAGEAGSDGYIFLSMATATEATATTETAIRNYLNTLETLDLRDCAFDLVRTGAAKTETAARAQILAALRDNRTVRELRVMEICFWSEGEGEGEGEGGEEGGEEGGAKLLGAVLASSPTLVSLYLGNSHFTDPGFAMVCDGARDSASLREFYLRTMTPTWPLSPPPVPSERRVDAAQMSVSIARMMHLNERIRVLDLMHNPFALGDALGLILRTLAANPRSALEVLDLSFQYNPCAANLSATRQRDCEERARLLVAMLDHASHCLTQLKFTGLPLVPAAYQRQMVTLLAQQAFEGRLTLEVLNGVPLNSEANLALLGLDYETFSWQSNADVLTELRKRCSYVFK